MASTTAITEIGKIIDKYIFKYKLPQEDYFLYLQHGCDCLREINTRHSNNVVTTKIAVSALGIIEMPSDMIGFCGVYMPINGELWSFTKKGRKVMTTTTTLGVEGQDADMGEGVDVLDDSYIPPAGRGGVNSYYFNIDWSARRIFCDGIKSDTAVLQYTSSGLTVSGNTYVPQECEIVIDAYLNWKKEQIEPRSISMLQYTEEKYKEEVLKLRIWNFMPSRDEIADVWDKSSTRSFQR